MVNTAKSIMIQDPELVANLAVYAREVFHMRSVTHVLAVELSNHPQGRKFARKTVERVAKRPDDMTEMMAYQLANYEKTHSQLAEKRIGGCVCEIRRISAGKIQPDRKGRHLKEWNLNSYGTQQFVGSKTNLIGGWSEKALDFIRLAEEGTNSLVKAIMNYQ